jgi:hypothetical protein
LSRPEFQSSTRTRHQIPAALGVFLEMEDSAGAGVGAVVAAKNQNGAAIGWAGFEVCFSWRSSCCVRTALWRACLRPRDGLSDGCCLPHLVALSRPRSPLGAAGFFLCGGCSIKPGGELAHGRGRYTPLDEAPIDCTAQVFDRLPRGLKDELAGAGLSGHFGSKVAPAGAVLIVDKNPMADFRENEATGVELVVSLPRADVFVFAEHFEWFAHWCLPLQE